MRTAKIKFDHLNGEVAEMYYIDSNESLQEYLQFMKYTTDKAFMDTVFSSLPLYKFDHAIPFTECLEKGIMQLAWVRSRHNQIDIDEEGKSFFNNPLYQLHPSMLLLKKTIEDQFKRNGFVFVGKSGGVMFVNKGYEILETYESEIKNKAPENVMRGGKWIVLENDWVLPKESIEFLKKQDDKFCVFYDLRRRFRRLEECLEKFKHDGGETVFIYTTGSDYDQMYLYTEVVKKVGLDDLRFYFSLGTDRTINDFISWAKQTIKNVTVYTELEN